jgi:hypothetical protein
MGHIKVRACNSTGQNILFIACFLCDTYVELLFGKLMQYKQYGVG